MVPILHGLQRIGFEGRRSTLESDSQRLIDTETGGHNGGTAATPPDTKPGGTKPATAGNASKQKSPSKRTEQTALQKEQRKAAAAQAAVEDLQRRLAAVEAALAAERQQAADAQRALAEQRPAAETPPETPEQTVEQISAGGAAFGLMPLAGFRGTDLFHVSQTMIEQADKPRHFASKTRQHILQYMG